MKEIKSMLIWALMFSFLFASAAVVITGFGGDATNLPAQDQANELITRTESYSEDFAEVAESPTGGIITGITGLGQVIKLVVFDAPSYAGAVIEESFAFLRLPGSFATLIKAILIIIVITTGILLLRGVKG